MLPISPPINEGSTLTEMMIYYCTHCNYKSQSRWNVNQHQHLNHQNQQQRYLTPIEMNKCMLYSKYRFKPQSKLKVYLFNKTKIKKNYYMLIEIMEKLKMIIRFEKLYDPKNPSIIICDSDLENVLDVRDLHVTEVRDQILKHLTRVKGQDWKMNLNTFISKSEGTITSSKLTRRLTSRSLTRTTNVLSTLAPNKETKFTVKPLLMRLLKTECEEKDKTKIVFRYEEIVNLLSKYIMKRRNSLFDHRNIKIARVHLDPLGRALGDIIRFHRCQMENLLRAQLTLSP